MSSNSFKKENYLFYKNKAYIAFHKLKGKDPGIIFLHGLNSDMTGNKALAIEKFAKRKKLSFIRFDFRGHGNSYGKFEDFGISDWADDILFILDKLTNSKQILVGSSMGGWVMMLAAIKQPFKIHSLLGVAAAPDFTKEIFEKQLTNLQKKKINKIGSIKIQNTFDEDPYIISKALLDQGKNNLLLNDLIKIQSPVHLLHGEKDEVVPSVIGIKLLEKLTSSNKKLIVLGNAEHRFSEKNEITEIYSSLRELIKIK